MIYSLILRNQNIIADYSETEGDFQQVAMKILKTLKHSPNNSQNSIVVNYEQFDFNILIEDSFTFVCLTKSDSNHNKILEYLMEIKQRFKELYQHEKDRLYLLSVTLIKELMSIYKENISYEKLNAIENDLEDMKLQIKKNIDKTIEKDFQLDYLLLKSENLSKSSNNYKIKSKKKVIEINEQRSNFFCLIVLFSIGIILAFYFISLKTGNDNLKAMIKK